MQALPTTDEVTAQGLKKSAAGAAIPSEIPDTLAKLTKDEKKIWAHVTSALHEVGLVHKTDAMMINIICKTFSNWVKAEQLLQQYMDLNGGSWMSTSPNGYQQPHQSFYVARNLKKELLDWLPHAALTIPTFHKVVGERAAPAQGTLFDDPVAAHRDRKAQIGMRLVSGNGSQ
jgi:phage terminase small subunit